MACGQGRRAGPRAPHTDPDVRCDVRGPEALRQRCNDLTVPQVSVFKLSLTLPLWVEVERQPGAILAACALEISARRAYQLGPTKPWSHQISQPRPMSCCRSSPTDSASVQL